MAKKPNKKTPTNATKKQTRPATGKTTNGKGRKTTIRNTGKGKETGKRKPDTNKQGSKRVQQNPVRKGNRHTKSKVKSLQSGELENLLLLELVSGLDLTSDVEEKRPRISKESSPKSNVRKDKEKGKHKSDFRPVKFTERKKRNDDLYTISFKPTTSERLIKSIDVSNFKSFTKATKDLPSYAVVFIKTYNKVTKEHHFFAVPSGFTRSVTTPENIKKFVAESLANFNNDTVPEIMNSYDVNYNDIKIVSISIRFIYPKESQPFIPKA